MKSTYVMVALIALIIVALGFAIFGPQPTWEKRRAECQDVKHGVYLRAEGVCIDVRMVPLSE